ncbi:unnamed protein product [Sphagnum balticum]
MSATMWAWAARIVEALSSGSIFRVETRERPPAHRPDFSAINSVVSDVCSSSLDALQEYHMCESRARPTADPPHLSATSSVTSDVRSSSLDAFQEYDEGGNRERPAGDLRDVSATRSVRSEAGSSSFHGPLQECDVGESQERPVADPQDVSATTMITSEEYSGTPASADPPDVSATTTITAGEDSSRPAGTDPPEVSATKLVTSEKNSTRTAADPPDVSPTNKSVTSEASSSNFDALHEYDVFVSHRGTKSNLTFVSSVYEALCTAGFHPCLDAKSFVKGKHAFNSMNKALSGVSVRVAVFPSATPSPNIVSPTYTTCCEAARDEAQLKRRIVIGVQNAMPVDHGLQQVVPHRVGLQDSTREVLQHLDQVGIVGIVGMGGIGKTTLAKEVYNECAKGQRFECQSFLRDVRVRDQWSFQKQLVRDLLEQDLENIEEFYHCFNRLSKKVLIVVDDIDGKSQFDPLIPALDKSLPRGS